MYVCMYINNEYYYNQVHVLLLEQVTGSESLIVMTVNRFPLDRQPLSHCDLPKVAYHYYHYYFPTSWLAETSLL